MQLVDCFGASLGMQTVDILCDDSLHLALTLQFCQLVVGCVGRIVQRQHLLPVKVEKFGGMRLIEGMAQHGLGWVLEFHGVQPVHAAKIGNTRLGGDAGTSKKHDVVAVCNPTAQSFNRLIHCIRPPTLSIASDPLYL